MRSPVRMTNVLVPPEYLKTYGIPSRTTYRGYSEYNQLLIHQISGKCDTSRRLVQVSTQSFTYAQLGR